MFSEDERFHVVASASDGERLVDAIRRFTADVVVMGWQMPYMDAEEVLDILRTIAEPPRAVIFSGLDDPDIPRRAMALGAAGFCSKQEAPEELLQAVAGVAAGRMSFPYMDMAAVPERGPLDDLTVREYEVLATLAGGGTIAKIAGEMGVSTNTVKFHLKNLYDKLQVSNRAQAVVLYLSSQDPQATRRRK